jgi:hypothetical protein
MRRIALCIVAQYFTLIGLFAQVNEVKDTTNYSERKLKIEEVNFVSGYYQQDGNNSGVTGGIGTEKLTDFANTLEIKVSKTNKYKTKHSFALELGVDAYTSASSDNINPAISGPSRKDMRIYPSLNWTAENEKKTLLFGSGISYSHEFDYESRGLNLNFVKSSLDNNREFGVKLFAFFDSWGVILPYELRTAAQTSASGQGRTPLDYKPRNSYQASISYSQVINSRLQISLMLDPSYQSGQLTTLYQRVYFSDNSEKVEKLPDTRLKFPIGIRANYFLGDRIVLRGFYRYYTDDWGNKAHTTSLEIPIKITPFFSLSPFYRLHYQTGIDYFAAYKQHNVQDEYYTSDFDLSKLTSHFLGAGIHLSPPKGIFGNEHFNSLDIRYGHYIRNTGSGLYGNIITFVFKFK